MMKSTSKCIQRAIAARKAAGKNHPWLYVNYSSKEQDEVCRLQTGKSAETESYSEEC